MSLQVVKRGYVPKDQTEFGAVWKARMDAAANDIRYLLDHGYPVSPAVTFVGNHYLLSERQRMALTRGLASRERLCARREKELQSLSGTVSVDGFNTVITLEVALSGSLLLGCDDGTIRDLAGLHGTYRIVDKTVRAVELMLGALERTGADRAVVFLDRPVSNSGRLKALIEEKGAHRRLSVDAELLSDVDRQLSGMSQVVTSDEVILDRCGGWYNLNRRIIEESIPEAWLYSFH